MDLTGIHHLTAVSADIRANYRFYTQTLGMRLVKRSVNQDEVDEDPATLGEHVALPPFLEPKRQAILAGLEPIT